jgi:hypothetical protein
MPARYVELQDDRVATPPGLYAIRIKGRLGATALSAFPTMLPEVEGGDTVLTGWLEDRSAVFGLTAWRDADAQACLTRPQSSESDDDRSSDGV